MIARLHLPGAGSGALIELAGPQCHYLGRVLRLRRGAPLQVFDGEGGRFAAELTTLEARHGSVRVGAPLPALADGALRITLAQGLSAADRMDWTIEKAVELGVTTIVPLACERSQVKLDAQRAARRHEHWQRLIVAACTQCGRDRLPRLLPVVQLAGVPVAAQGWPPGTAHGQDEPRTEPDGLLMCPATSRLLLTAPGQVADALPLSHWQLPAGEDPIGGQPGAGAHGPAGSSAAHPAGPVVTLAVGPESGFSAPEIALLRQRHFTPVTLGPRVLRTETAGLAAIAALQVKFGDF